MQNFILLLWHDLAATTFFEYIAVIFGILSVWFASRENIWVYPTGIINVALYIFLFITAKIYAQALVQVFYLVLSIYGWYNWVHHPSSDGQTAITRLDLKGWIFSIGLIIVGTILFYFLLSRYTDSPVPMLDSFTTAVFFVTMWLMAIKKIENWLGWTVGNLILIPLSIMQHLAFTSIQYFVFLFLAFSGWIEWNKKIKNAQPK
ncbi:MAG: nicotinamide mononucleotide transporter [Bacteroidetes bacterium]|nr:nicotinamide mononucleotide transporter [Bacteroidota bacterium]